MNSEDVDNGKVRDRSAYDNHGSINGTVNTGLPGPAGGSVDFSARGNGHLSTSNTPEKLSFNTNEKYTVSAWVTATEFGVGLIDPIVVVHQGNNQTRFTLDGPRLAYRADDGNFYGTSAGTPFIGDGWHHAVWVVNNGTFKGYVNGEESVTESLPEPNTDCNGDVGIAQGAGSSEYLDGKLSDVRIYPSRALSKPEIKQLYNQRSSRTMSVGGIDTSNVTASGGNEYTKTVLDVDYKIHEFTSDGTFSVSEGGNVDVLVVGGGGGGGANDAGGGGAGGVIYETVSVSSNNYSITVGSGGSGNQSQNGDGQPGEDSVAFGLTAIGGGKGVRQQRVGGGGGSGGAGGHPTSSGGQALQPTSADGGFGKDGGSGDYLGDPYPGGGGGGAGSIGQSPSTSSERGHGGDGLYFGDAFSDQFGENGYFAGGGGGGSHQDPPSDGGIGGGGNGGTGDSGISTTVQDGQPNTGGGGGGSGEGGVQNGGNGGSGIVLIRYKK